MPLHELAPPGIDLLVDIDLHRAHIGAAAIERGCKRQVAVFSGVERRIDDETDRAGVGGPVTQATAAAVNRAGIHAGAAANTFERGPELAHAEALGTPVIHEHDVHLPTGPRAAEVRRVLSHGGTERAA